DLRDRPLELVGDAEVEMRRPADEAQALDDDRIVEAELLAQFGALRRRRVLPDHLVDRVADEAEQRKRDQRHHDDDADRLDEAPDGEREHGLAVPKLPGPDRIDPGPHWRPRHYFRLAQ